MLHFAISDIHGSYSAMLEALENAGYESKNPNHQIVCCGDMFGRAQNNLDACVNIWHYLTDAEKHANLPVCIRGNHEDILIEAIKRRKLDYIDCQNGEHHTFASFDGTPAISMQYDICAQNSAAKKMKDCGFYDWLISLPYYYETENNLFIHGFLPVTDDKRNFDFVTKDFDKVTENQWKVASWSVTPKILPFFEIGYPHGIDKTIVFGHWATMDLIKLKNPNKPIVYGEIFEDKELKLIGLDGTTAYTHKVICKILEN